MKKREGIWLLSICWRKKKQDASSSPATCIIFYPKYWKKMLCISSSCLQRFDQFNGKRYNKHLLWMYVCVCVYVCMYVYVCTCMYVCFKKQPCSLFTDVLECPGHAYFSFFLAKILISVILYLSLLIKGALTEMPAVRIFALYSGMSVLLNFLLQVTAFVALLSLDARRQEVCTASNSISIQYCPPIPGSYPLMTVNTPISKK